MPNDAYTLRYVAEELNKKFSGGKINRITTPDINTALFTVYTGKKTEKLVIDVSPSKPRINTIETEPESPLTASNFCMLLRKHLLTASIDKIELKGFDRVIEISCTYTGEFTDGVEKKLIIELMGRYSNIILTEGDKILGANRKINDFDNGVRPLIVGTKYTPPSDNGRVLPSDKKVIEIFDNSDENSISETLLKTVQGLAKETAKEIESTVIKNRVSVKDGKVIGEKFYKELNGFLYSETTDPAVYIKGNKPVFYSVREYGTEYDKKIKFATVSEAENYYNSYVENEKILTAYKTRFSSLVNTAVKKVKKRLTSITAREKEAENYELNKIKGELILSNIYRIKTGEEKVYLENFYDEGKVIEIALDKTLTPQKNAEKYFKAYNKQKRTTEMIKPQKETALKEIEYYESLLSEIDMINCKEDGESVKEELEETGLIKRENKNVKKQKKSMREYLIDGYTVYCGRNNVENDEITFSASGEDIWVHSKDYHSSHLIIKTDGKEPTEKTIKTVCEICAYYSKARDGGKTEVVYVKKKNVKKPKGAKAGFVTYENYASFTVESNKHEELLKRQ